MASRFRSLTLGMLCSAVACSTPSENEPSPDSPRAGSAGTGGTSGPSAGAGGASGAAGSVGKAGGAGTAAGGSAGTASGAAGTGGANGGAAGGGAGGSAGAAGSSAGDGGSAAAAGGAAGSAGAGAGGAAGSGSDRPVYAYAATVENTGADCAVAALAEPTALPKNSKFPDPFKTIAGTRITKKSDWRCRRQELNEQAKKYVYGQKPTPDAVTGTVTNNKITVHVEAEGKSIDFSADIVLPSQGEGPFPAIINVGAKGGFGGISLGESRILEQGVAVIYYNHNELGQEGTPEQSRGKPNPGKFYDIYGGTHSAGLLMAWAWGASRLIDVLQAAGGDVIDFERLGVTGCSRNGKGAFAVGVFDERIALTIPQETSTAGVPAFRIVDQLNTERTDHNFFGLNWLSDDFEPFVLNADQLPLETHELVAMIAPRGLLVLDNPHQRQMSAPAGHAAAMGGLEVYKALGVEGNLSYHSNVSDMAHCSYKSEYTALLAKNIAKFLKHENEEPGQVIVGANGSTNLAEWKDWETPTLAD